MGAGGSSAHGRAYRVEQWLDDAVLLEIVKPKGKEIGLGLTTGDNGAIEVVYCEDDSPFTGLIEPGDMLYQVNGVSYTGAEAREAAQHIRNADGIALLGTFKKPPPPPVRLPPEEDTRNSRRGSNRRRSSVEPTSSKPPQPLRREESVTAKIFTIAVLKRAARRMVEFLDARRDARPVPTAEQCKEISEEAEAQIKKLDLASIKLSLTARRIEAQPITFEEGGEGEGVFGQTAREICDEVARAMKVCNDILDAKGLRRFGLSIEGHTSAVAKAKEEKAPRVPLHLRGTAASASRQKEKVEYTPKMKADPDNLIALSMKRACTVARRIKKTYKTLGNSTVTVQAMGHGATRPLPGYDDGKPHPENRRIEFRLLVGDEVELRPRSFNEGIAQGNSSRVLVSIDDHDEDVVSPPPRRLSVSRAPGARRRSTVAPG